MDGTVATLARYPIKGLSAEPLHTVNLTEGQGFPFDRVFGFARPQAEFDAADPKPMRKGNFYMLARDAALAALAVRVDQDSQVMTLTNGAGSQEFALDTQAGAAAAEEAIAAHLDLPAERRPRLLKGRSHRFTDVSVVSETFMHAVSLINLATVRDLAERTGETIEPERFRGNVMFDGWPAWSEMELEGRTIIIGAVEMKVLLRTERCPATAVNPHTAERDVPVPKLLRQTVGHGDLGIYAAVTRGGKMSVGDPIRLA